jgi:hypothetical protein
VNGSPGQVCDAPTLGRLAPDDAPTSNKGQSNMTGCATAAALAPNRASARHALTPYPAISASNMQAE